MALAPLRIKRATAHLELKFGAELGKSSPSPFHFWTFFPPKKGFVDCGKGSGLRNVRISLGEAASYTAVSFTSPEALKALESSAFQDLGKDSSALVQ